MMEKTDVQILELNWKSSHRLGAIAALLAVLFAMLEILITFIPGCERFSPELLTSHSGLSACKPTRCSNCATWDW